MNLAQLEHADAYADPLPASDTVDRMARLIEERRDLVDALDRKERALRGLDRWRAASGILENAACEGQRIKLNNEANQMALRLWVIKREIVNVARQLVAEDAAGEVIQ